MRNANTAAVDLSLVEPVQDPGRDLVHSDHPPDEEHRILAVDDDEIILQLMAEALRGQRYKVDVATSCQDALPLLMFRDYCGVILDLVLPDANGLTLYRQIARRKPVLRPRVIFVTGAMDKREARRFVKLLDNPVLLKPFHLEELVEAVRVLELPKGIK
ncbi:MAG TPA: response regulator [Candidatus Polarisedimenticolia bacterium]|nr:response regulator [Candidatus Polarisedimenticolia bacterium]